MKFTCFQLVRSMHSLKTLEEPPAHVVFLFATTEPNKIPQTILSRCQRYDFKNALLGDVTGHLKRICESEGIKLQSDELLKILSEKGNGSIRDALSLLDQVLALSENNMITEETLIQSLGVARLSAVRELVTSLVEGSYSQVSQTYQAIIRENVEVKNLVNQVLDHVYTILQNIDSPTSLYEKGIVNKNALKKVTTAEMFWIYEGLNKDLAWALESINPVKVVDITLKKYTLRRMILNADDTPLDRGEATPEAPRKTWDTFIQNLKENEAGIYTNFERGDLIEKPFISDEQVSLSMAFEHGAQVFYEYFQEKEASDKLRSKISEYFEVETKNVKINFKLLDDEQAEEKNFQSMYSKEKEAEEKKEEEMKQKLLNSDNIKSLEKEFNAKADKVILNK
jgi:DNA polymerase III gamma/tau subunit